LIVLLATVLAAAVLAGCGSSSSTSSPLQTELSYVPAGSPVVVSIQTDPHSAAVKSALAFLNRFPFASFLESAVITRLKQAGVNYETQIRPLFGNPAVIGLTDASVFSRQPTGHGSRHFVVVWVTHDASALNSLVQSTSSGLHKVGSHAGATLYRTNGACLGVDGATLILAPSIPGVIDALDRHANGGGITSAAYSGATAGLPSDALVTVFGSLQRLLATSPRAASAVRIPWIAAIKSYGASISLSSTGLSVHFHVDTTGSSLTGSELPIAPGAAMPELATGFPISAGLRDPQHAVGFVEAAVQAASPEKWAKFESRQARLRAKTGADVNQVLHQLTGNLVVASDAHLVLARADLADPALAARTLDRLATDPRDAFQTASVSKAGPLYVTHMKSGTLILGVASGKFVIGSKATPAQVQAFATAPTRPAAAAQGPLAFSVAVPEILRLALRGAGNQIPPTLFNALGDLTGWVSATTAGLQGSATLAFR
jgi:hypothetical protein